MILITFLFNRKPLNIKIMNFYNNYFKKIILKEDFFFIIVNILKILHWHVNEILYKNYPGYCRIKIIVGNKW